MCAINGFNFKDEDLILKMNKITAHRGPDGTGVFVNDNISLGHNRLSIIDLSKQANQPMKSFDGKQVIVLNGEIYNFKELKKELKDYPFKAKSDAEVVLAAYRKWGHKCVKWLGGIFAFAIWDKEKDELFIARDHIGVKPLYYFWDPSTGSEQAKFIFSSEIKAILEHKIPRILNKEAFNHYLRVLYVPEPLTMFDEISKFPPASFGVLKNGKFKITSYWQVQDYEFFKEGLSEIQENLRSLIFQSVKRQLISDKPLGIYLSGGTDSSIVLHNVAKIKEKIDTFSAGFKLTEGEEREKFNADLELAKKTSKYYGVNHNKVLVSPEDVVDLFEKLAWYTDEPISNPTAISMMKLAAFTKNKVDVVLGGDGGDELFGGHKRYRLSSVLSTYQKLPRVFRKILSYNKELKKLNTKFGIERFALFMFQKNNILERIIDGKFLDCKITKKFFEDKFFDKSSLKKCEQLFMEIDRRSWLVDYSLMLTDKTTMSVGLEARAPLLSKELAEFASKIPLKYKVNCFDTKIILKKAYKNQLPDFLFNQPKRGWVSPGAKWLRYPKIYDMAQAVLSENYYKETHQLFKWNNIQKVLKNHCSKKEYNLIIIWALLTFQLWARRYKVKI